MADWAARIGMTFGRAVGFTPTEVDTFPKVRTIRTLWFATVSNRGGRPWCMAYRRTGVGMAFIRSFRFTPAEADAFTKLRTIHRPRFRLAAIAHRSRRAWCMADWSTGGGMTLIGLFRFAPAKVHAAPELATIDGFRLTTVADGDRCSSHMTDGEARVFMAFVRPCRLTPRKIHTFTQG